MHNGAAFERNVTHDISSSYVYCKCTLFLSVFPTLTKLATLICLVNICNTFPDKRACWAKVGNTPIPEKDQDSKWTSYVLSLYFFRKKLSSSTLDTLFGLFSIYMVHKFVLLCTTEKLRRYTTLNRSKVLIFL